MLYTANLHLNYSKLIECKLTIPYIIKILLNARDMEIHDPNSFVSASIVLNS